MRIKPLLINYNNKIIRGTHYQNESSNKFPVLLVHGFGSNRIGVGRCFVKLAKQMNEAGFVVFAFDRLGHGESDGKFIDVSPNDEILQLHKMVDTILAMGFKKIHVVGHSLGGMESAKLAAERPEDIISLTLWAAAAVFAFEIAEKGEIQGKSVDKAEEKGYFDFKGQRLGWKFIKEAKSFKPYEGLEHFKNKVFIHQGEEDAVVPMKYAKRYLEVWNENGTLYTYPNADHGWNSLDARDKLLKQTIKDIIDSN